MDAHTPQMSFACVQADLNNVQRILPYIAGLRLEIPTQQSGHMMDNVARQIWTQCTLLIQDNGNNAELNAILSDACGRMKTKGYSSDKGQYHGFCDFLQDLSREIKGNNPNEVYAIQKIHKTTEFILNPIYSMRTFCDDLQRAEAEVIRSHQEALTALTQEQGRKDMEHEESTRALQSMLETEQERGVSLQRKMEEAAAAHARELAEQRSMIETLKQEKAELQRESDMRRQVLIAIATQANNAVE